MGNGVVCTIKCYINKMITYFVYFFFSSFTSSRIPRREPDYSYTVYFSQNNTIAVITTAETERGEIMSGGIKAERVCVYIWKWQRWCASFYLLQTRRTVRMAPWGHGGGIAACHSSSTLRPIPPQSLFNWNSFTFVMTTDGIYLLYIYSSEIR